MVEPRRVQEVDRQDHLRAGIERDSYQSPIIYCTEVHNRKQTKERQKCSLEQTLLRDSAKENVMG
jgi:hypothetical protein